MVKVTYLFIILFMQKCSALRWHPRTPIQDHLSSLFLSPFSNSGNVATNQTLVLFPVQTIISSFRFPTIVMSLLCSLILISHGSNSNTISWQVLKLRKEIAAESILLAKMREYPGNIIRQKIWNGFYQCIESWLRVIIMITVNILKRLWSKVLR